VIGMQVRDVLNSCAAGVSVAEFPTTSMEMQAVADKFDRNGDGFIDYEEFIFALRPEHGKVAKLTLYLGIFLLLLTDYLVIETLLLLVHKLKKGSIIVFGMTKSRCGHYVGWRKKQLKRKIFKRFLETVGASADDVLQQTVDVDAEVAHDGNWLYLVRSHSNW